MHSWSRIKITFPAAHPPTGAVYDYVFCNSRVPASQVKIPQTLNIIVGFFIPVSSLKVFGHSIHSERRRIYPEKSIQSFTEWHHCHIMVIQFQSHPAKVQWHTLKTFIAFYVCFHIFFFITKPLQGIWLLSI